ncbi:MAG: hypothetical protein KTR22_00865 [Flavobacteriaceae bacterium]|nr:hypothetical protein [Flavobacteriaceae bacterium]
MNIFGKIRKKLLADHKVSKYLVYAIGEIILVVVGILIAIQINGWNQNRMNRSKETLILQELHEESKQNLAQFESNKQGYIQSLNACRIVLRNVRKMDAKEAMDSVMRYGPSMFRGITFDPSNGVVESLINTGELQLIRNDSLRRYIATWKNVVTDFKEEEQNSRALWTNHIEPFIIENGNFLNPSDPKNIILFKDPIFLNMIARRQFYVSNIIDAMDREHIEKNLKAMVRLSNVQ